MNDSILVDFGKTIAMQSIWLQLWLLILVTVNFSAIFFVVTRTDGNLRARVEAIAITLSFLASGILLMWIYEKVGYVQLLGLAHIVFWVPVYVWLWLKYQRSEFFFPFKQYVVLYFVINGISLVIDVVEVAHYLFW